MTFPWECGSVKKLRGKEDDGMKRIIFCSIFIAILVLGCMAMKEEPMMEEAMMEEPPFGGEADVAFANDLWEKMEAGGFNSTPGVPQDGNAPHGAVIETLQGEIDGQMVIVKRNYGGEGVSVEAVEADRTKFLAAVTVMVKREAGYDDENMNWYWVKYKANGEIDVNPNNTALAGRVAKGADTGCIACHNQAVMTDMVFSFDEANGLEVTMIE
jgi:hypothetical protein